VVALVTEVVGSMITIQMGMALVVVEEGEVMGLLAVGIEVT
jgi:hypothetical protein